MLALFAFLRNQHKPRLFHWILGGLIVSSISVAIFAGSSASAQPSDMGLRIDAVTLTRISANESGVRYRARVTIGNPAETDFSGVQRVDYRIDDGDPQLAYIVTDLAGGNSRKFTMDIELLPGERTVHLMLGDETVSRSVSVSGADLAIRIIKQEVTRGRTVEFTIAVTNEGASVARDLALVGTWEEVDGDVSGEVDFEGPLSILAGTQRTTVVMPVQVQSGTFSFSFAASTSTIEDGLENNAAEVTLDVEFIDLQVSLGSSESLGWDGEGNALMSIDVEVENIGVDDANTFYIGLECNDEASTQCSASVESQPIPAGESSEAELRAWLPIGDNAVRIYAVKNEDTFLWGESNVIDATVTAPTAPEETWTIVGFSEPSVVSYWSDGSANVEFDLTLLNNGTDESSTITAKCMQGEALVEGCGSEVEVKLETDVYPTVLRQSIRLPKGDTDLFFEHGDQEPSTLAANVPERLIGIERDVWDCFIDTSNLDPETGEQDEDNDEGIGCAGWDDDFIVKWPVGEPIKVWSFGDNYYLEILDEVLEYVGPLMNVSFESVVSKDDAQLTIYTGIPREQAESTGLNCVDFGGCARTFTEEDGRITKSAIAIWTNNLRSASQREHSIRATTLHELIHSLGNVEHRHHDRTSVMSYEALDYTTIEGMDLGLLEVLGHPLVLPGMSFDEVEELIVFADELNDPPEPEELSARALLRRSHAALIDAGSMSFEVKGGWPGCSGVHDFGWADLQFANLSPNFALWRHFSDGSDRYFYIGNPSDWDESEWWLRRGRNWDELSVERVSDSTTFRGGFSSVMQMLSDINTYADDSDLTVVSRTANRVEIEVTLDQPNPHWSRNLKLGIRIVLNPDTYVIEEYEMNWKFRPRSERSCDRYAVEARSAEYGIEFTFPDEIRDGSKLLVSDDEATEDREKVVMVTN